MKPANVGGGVGSRGPTDVDTLRLRLRLAGKSLQTVLRSAHRGAKHERNCQTLPLFSRRLRTDLSPDRSPPFTPHAPRFRLTDPGFLSVPLLPIVIAALDDRGWTYTTNEELGLLTFGVSGEHAGYNCALFADDETRLVTMIAQSALRIPLEERGPACEMLMRVNHGLMFGGFDIDFADGEVRYKVSVDVEGGTLGVPAVHSMITVALDMYELWYAPLMKVVYGGVSPEHAVAEVNRRFDASGGERFGEDDDDADDADDPDDADTG